jgi:hypothetical protein
MILAQAAEAATTFQGIPGAPDWLNSLLVLVVPIISYFAVQHLRARRAEVEARLQNENLTRKERLELRLRNFLLMRAEAFLEKDMFEIAGRVAKAKASGGASEPSIMAFVKEEFQTAHEKLDVAAKDYFTEDDVNIAEELGQDAIDAAIRWAVDKSSPFPGKPTVQTLVSGGAEMLLNKGAAWTKKHITETGEVFVSSGVEEASS